MKNISFSALLLIFLCTTINAITIGEIVNPLEDFLECKDLKWYENIICKDLAQRVYSSLDDRGIGFSNGDIVLTVHPVTPQRQLDTGHSCTHRAWIKDNYATARLLSHGSLEFSGDSISEPLVFMADFPINIYTRVYLRESAGQRNPLPWNDNCIERAVDHFYADSNINTEMHIGMSLSLEPKLLDERTAEGDYQIQIAPIFFVESQLKPTEINFSFHNKDGAWIGFVTWLTTLGSNLVDIVRDIRHDGKVSDSVKEQLKQDLIISHGSMLLEMTDDRLQLNLAEDYVTDIAMELVARKQDELGHKTRELENDIDAQISAALGLDADGKRTYVVDKSLVDALFMSSLIPAIQIIL